jgi:endonuclease/exonuclease/phosphatase family metal-dependent hydrolase
MSRVPMALFNLKSGCPRAGSRSGGGHDFQRLQQAATDLDAPPALWLVSGTDQWARFRPLTWDCAQRTGSRRHRGRCRPGANGSGGVAPRCRHTPARCGGSEMTAATISLLSYNLRDYGKSAMVTRRQQHELLRFERPDVVCLQEIWDDSDDLSDLDRHVATLADCLGMRAMAVPARRSHCHMAILWRPEFAAMSQRSHDLALWHGLGVVQLDVGAAVPLRVAVTHLAPWDPEKRLADVRTITGLLDDPGQATVIAGDWNSFGADATYDPEPDWSRLPSHKIWRHLRWNDDPDTPPQVDRRPTELLRRSGLHDAAVHLRAPWQATGGHMDTDLLRRLDACWTTRPQALVDYEVIDTPVARLLSDHFAIRVGLAPGALGAAAVPVAGQSAPTAPESLS